MSPQRSVSWGCPRSVAYAWVFRFLLSRRGEDETVPETLSVWGNRFLDDLAGVRRLSPLTIRAYRRELTRFLEMQALAKTPLTSRP